MENILNKDKVRDQHLELRSFTNQVSEVSVKTQSITARAVCLHYSPENPALVGSEKCIIDFKISVMNMLKDRNEAIKYTQYNT